LMARYVSAAATFPSNSAMTSTRSSSRISVSLSCSWRIALVHLCASDRPAAEISGA
jgi:hypothetical protein